MKRRIAVFTSSRADLGPLGPVIRALDQDPCFELVVIATGTHLVDLYGGRLGDIQMSERSVLETIDAGISGSRPSDLGESYGRIATGMSRILDRRTVGILVLLGDRWELLAAAGAALIHGVPIAHIHGGETTEGAIDERIRHGITKLADLHYCATHDSARRIRQLGEESWRIVVTGAPGLDRLSEVIPLSDSEVEELTGKPMVRPFGVIVYHPPTIDRAHLEERARAVFDAGAETLGLGLVLYPGADPGAEIVIDEIESAVSRHENLATVRNLGDRYPSLLRAADVLIGNSSSGIIEAASFRLSVVDIGERQRGRLRPRNVLHTGEKREQIVAGIREALSAGFRQGFSDLKNPYGTGRASAKILQALLDAPLERLKRKPLMENAPSDPTLEGMVVAPGVTLRDAMSAIDRGRSQIAFVCDDQERLLGSISDGDIRRALLGGAELDSALDPFMNRVPVVVSPSDDFMAVLEIMERNGVTQVPVVDDRGALIGVHLMRAIVRRALDGAILGADVGPDADSWASTR